MRPSAKGTDAGCRQRVRDALRLLVLDQPFFGMLALRLRIVEDPSADTMWVDGVTLGYNPAFVATLTNGELQGLVCHEVLHVAAGHPWRRGVRERHRYNDACDYAINPIVRDAGMVLPEGGLLDLAFKGLAAEVIYERLPDRVPGGGQGSQAGPDDGGNEEDEEAGELPEPGEAPEENDNCPGAADSSATNGDGEGGDAPRGARASIGEVRDAPADQPELEAQWKMAVEAATKAAGSLPGSLAELVEEVKKPKVDWREVLRAFVQQAAGAPDYRFSLPNRRYVGLGLYLPALAGESPNAIVIAVDTSASVSTEMLAQFHGEIRAVLEEVKPQRTLVIYADYVVQAVQEVFPEDAFVFEAKGRGGTSFIPAFDYVAEEGIQPECLIYLTDLKGEAPALPPGYPVLWVTPATRLMPPWGRKVELVG